MYVKPFSIDRIDHNCLRICDADGCCVLDDVFNHQIADDEHPIVAQDRADWVVKMNWVLAALNATKAPNFPTI